MQLTLYDFTDPWNQIYRHNSPKPLLAIQPTASGITRTEKPHGYAISIRA